MEVGLLIISDGESAVLIAFANSARAVGNDHVQDDWTKTKLTSHVPQATI